MKVNSCNSRVCVPIEDRVSARACPVSGAQPMSEANALAAANTQRGPRSALAIGYYFDSATTFFADCNIDIEYSLEALCLYALGCRSSRHATPQAIAHRRLSGVWRSCLVSTASPVPTGHKGSVFSIGLMRHSGG
jgi:hypothetical protein